MFSNANIGEPGYEGRKKLYEWLFGDTDELNRLRRKQAFWDMDTQIGFTPTDEQVEAILDRYLELRDARSVRDDEWEDMSTAIEEVLSDEPSCVS